MRGKLVLAVLGFMAAGGVAYGVSRGANLDERIAAATVHAFHAHVMAGETDAACALLTGHALAEWEDEPGGCRGSAREVSRIATPAQRDAARSLKILRVRISGDRGTIHAEDVEFPPGLEAERSTTARPTVLVRRDGRWLISDLG